MATSTRPLRVLWKREDATKVSVLLAIGVVVRVPAHKWAAGCPRYRRAARNGLRAPGSRGTASRRRRGGASCGAKRREKGEDLRPCEPMHGVSSAWITARMGALHAPCASGCNAATQAAIAGRVAECIVTQGHWEL